MNGELLVHNLNYTWTTCPYERFGEFLCAKLMDAPIVCLLHLYFFKIFGIGTAKYTCTTSFIFTSFTSKFDISSCIL